MGVFANLVLGLGGVIALVGFLFFWFPILGVPLIVIGGGLVFIGQALRREARKQAVRRQMGG